MTAYDLIIAGASFAGLAVASRITNGRVLLIDKNEIGTHQISACGTTVKMVERVGCEDSILRAFDTATVHLKQKQIDIELPEPLCTINFSLFCKAMAQKNSADFLEARVLGLKDSTVRTTKGEFTAPIIVDATGWQATLAASIWPNYVDKRMLSFGIESEIQYTDNRIRFFVDSKLIKTGVAWLFPCKTTARFGIGSYTGDTRLLGKLKEFVREYGLEIGELHGGYFGYSMRAPVVGNLFVVGDAAGQTLPLSGEGIRRSVYFGLKCGELINKSINEGHSINRCLNEYRDIALECYRYYEYLLRAQYIFPYLPNFYLNMIFNFLKLPRLRRLAWKEYEAI